MASRLRGAFLSRRKSSLTPSPHRPSERAALLNPAFMALLLSHVAAGHAKRAERFLPISLAFIAPPILLHGPTREALPKRATTKLGGWLEQHPIIRAGFPGRAEAISPAIRSGLRMGLRTGTLRLEEGSLASKPPRRRKSVVLTDEVEEILKRANFVGGWLGVSGPPAGQYALWRVRP